MSVDSALFGLNIDQEFQSTITDDNGVVHNMGDGNWLNYYPTKRVTKDLRYFWSIGIRRLRVASGDLSPNADGVESQFHIDRAQVHMHTCTLAVQMGFHVQHGVIPKAGIKPSEWSRFLDHHLPYAQQFQDILADNGGTGTWKIGNENEASFNLGRDAIVSMTRTSNVVTFVMSFPHGLLTGDGMVYFNAATGNGSGSTMGITSNSTFTITKIDDYIFTIPSTGTDGTSTIGWMQYASRTVRRIMKTLATFLKANGITVPLIYSCIQSLESAGAPSVPESGSNIYYIQGFSGGRGDIDIIGLNVYGDSSNHVFRFRQFMEQVKRGKSLYGLDHFEVTEWNLFANNSGVPSDVQDATYWMVQRKTYIEAELVRHYVFCYREGNNLLVLRLPYNTDVNGYWRDWWWPLIEERAQAVQTSSTSVSTPVGDLRFQKLQFTRASDILEFNYGQDQQDGAAIATVTVLQDLNALWDLGIRKIRIAASNYLFTNGVNNSKTLVGLAQGIGFETEWGVVLPGFGGGTDATWDAYVAAVETASDYAVSAGVTRFMIGNEVEYSETVSGTLTNSVPKILALDALIKARHPSLVRVYCMAQSSKEYVGAPDGWLEHAAEVIASGLILGYNIYGDSNLTVEQVREQVRSRTQALYDAFGSQLFISEWNLATGSARPTTEDEQGAELRRRLNMFEAMGIEDCYFFTMRWDKGSTSDKLNWPLISSGAYRRWFNYLFDDIPLDRPTGFASSRLPLDAPRGGI